MAPITVAIAGATGLAGSWIAQGFLSSEYFPEKVGRVIGFTRNAMSKGAEGLKANGAEIETRTPSVETFRGVDVFINALSTDADPKVWDDYVKAAVDAGVRVYFPSEYGFDHFSEKYNDNDVFRLKNKHAELAATYSEDRLKVIKVAVASFLNFGSLDYAADVGFDHAKGQYTVYGNPDAKISYNHLHDMAKSIVRLSFMALEDPKSVPDVIRLAGDTKSWSEIAQIVGKELGKPITVTSVDPTGFVEEAKTNFVTEIRLRMGSGEADFSTRNHNELVNPNQQYWKWKTVAEYTKERHGNFGF